MLSRDALRALEQLRVSAEAHGIRFEDLQDSYAGVATPAGLRATNRTTIEVEGVQATVIFAIEEVELCEWIRHASVSLANCTCPPVTLVTAISSALGFTRNARVFPSPTQKWRVPHIVEPAE